MPIIEGALGEVLTGAGAPVNGTDEVQTITPSAAVASGTFRLVFQGARTALLAFNVSAANMATALNGLATIGASGVGVTLDGGTGVYTVTFSGGNMLKLAQPLITVEDNTVKDAGNADVTLTVAEGTPGVTATGRGNGKGKIYIDTDTGYIYTNTGTALAPVWATGQLTTTAAEAELNLIDGSVAGTSVASKVLCLGANKNTDVLALPVSGLKIGAGAGTAMDCTAAELNASNGVTLGTAIASKVVTTDANIDTTGQRNVTLTGVLTAGSVLAKSPVTAVTADGAIAIPAGSRTYFITKAGVAAMTLANPTATTHDGVVLTFVSTTANAHTLDNSAGAGFNGGGAAKDIGTFGAAIGNYIQVVAYQGTWYVLSSTGVTLA